MTDVEGTVRGVDEKRRWGWGDWLILAVLVLIVLALALTDGDPVRWTRENWR